MLWTGFLFGLLGSLHCIGMCGPIALSLPPASSGYGFISGRVLYNLGRVFTYSILGLLFGFFGKGLQMAGLQQAVSILSGLLILIFLFFPSQTSSRISSGLGISKFVVLLKQKLGALLKKGSAISLFFIGILNGLLPCGFVYLALAGALSFESIFQSSVYMALFGMGTIPLMLLLAFSGKMLSLKFRNFINKTIPYAACFLAILFIIRGLSLNIPYISPDLSPKEGKTFHCH